MGAGGGVFVRMDKADAVEPFSRIRPEVRRFEKMWIGGTELEVGDLQWVGFVGSSNEKFPGSGEIEVGFGGKCGITGVFEGFEQKRAKGAKKLGVVAQGCANRERTMGLVQEGVFLEWAGRGSGKLGGQSGSAKKCDGSLVG